MPKPSACPSRHLHRDQCLRALEAGLLQGLALQEVAELTAQQLFLPAADAWKASRRAWYAARVRVIRATQDAADAARAFATAFRLWCASIRDEQGRARPAHIAGLLGGTRPGRLLQLPLATQLTKTADLLEQTEQAPEQWGDRERLMAVMAAREILEQRVGDKEGALLARSAAAQGLRADSQQFDRAWMVLVKLVRSLDPTRPLPRFREPAPSPSAPEAPVPEPCPAPTPDHDHAEPQERPTVSESSEAHVQLQEPSTREADCEHVRASAPPTTGTGDSDLTPWARLGAT